MKALPKNVICKWKHYSKKMWFVNESITPKKNVICKWKQLQKM
jgi:hypothetical protein